MHSILRIEMNEHGYLGRFVRTLSNAVSLAYTSNVLEVDATAVKKHSMAYRIDSEFHFPFLTRSTILHAMRNTGGRREGAASSNPISSYLVE